MRLLHPQAKGVEVQGRLVWAMRTYHPHDPNTKNFLKKATQCIVCFSFFSLLSSEKQSFFLSGKSLALCVFTQSLLTVSCKLELSHDLEGFWRRVGRMVQTPLMHGLRLLFHSMPNR